MFTGLYFWNKIWQCWH